MKLVPNLVVVDVLFLSSFGPSNESSGYNDFHGGACYLPPACRNWRGFTFLIATIQWWTNRLGACQVVRGRNH